jgi:uncharacterized protein (TIGR00730 family)
MAPASGSLRSVCVFCGSSDAADPAYLAAAGDLGRALAAADLRLVYGGGGVGLMGATARAAHEAGGKVLGIIPNFLVGKERAMEDVEHEVVTSMHERKQRFFEESDGYVILPGGIGTLEEVIELLSWRRLDLHTVDAKLTPASFMGAWTVVEHVEDIVPALKAGPRAGSTSMLASLS